MAGPLRIVSYNVRYFGHALRGLASTRTSKQAIAVRLAGLDPLPDIVCLQEVETISLRSRAAFRSPRGDHETQLESFMAELEAVFTGMRREFPYEAFYFRAHTYRLGDTPLYTTGLAILVNVRRLRVDLHNAASPEHITHHHVERWRDRKQSRICAHMQVSDGGVPLHIFNTHLSLPTPFARNFWSSSDKMGFGSNQLKEAASLSKFVQGLSGGAPFVICGDFNSPPASPVYQYLTGECGLGGAQACCGQIDPSMIRGFATAGFMRLRMHLDHIFFGGPIEWMDMEGTMPFGHRGCAFSGLSDHVPLIGRFRVNGSPLLG